MGDWFDDLLKAGQTYLNYDVEKTKASQSTNKSQTNAGTSATGSGITAKTVLIIGAVVAAVIGGAFAIKKLFF